MNAAEIIDQVLTGYLVAGKYYPRRLQPELQEWYCYTIDGGHSIVCAVKSRYKSGSGPESFLVPVPVKTVLRSYEQEGGYIVVDLPYHSELGLLVPKGDEEF